MSSTQVITVTYSVLNLTTNDFFCFCFNCFSAVLQTEKWWCENRQSIYMSFSIYETQALPRCTEFIKILRPVFVPQLIATFFDSILLVRGTLPFLKFSIPCVLIVRMQINLKYSSNRTSSKCLYFLFPPFSRPLSCDHSFEQVIQSAWTDMHSRPPRLLLPILFFSFWIW